MEPPRDAVGTLIKPGDFVAYAALVNSVTQTFAIVNKVYESKYKLAIIRLDTVLLYLNYNVATSGYDRKIRILKRRVTEGHRIIVLPPAVLDTFQAGTEDWRAEFKKLYTDINTKINNENYKE